MNKCFLFFIYFSCAVFILQTHFIITQTSVKIDPQELHEIGMKIWNNECNRTIEGLTSWNLGEDFASMGIGHFIWYAQGKKELFKQSFPELLIYLEENGKKLPADILSGGVTACPWQTREDFLKNQKSRSMISLRNFLVSTIDLQIKFIFDRLNNSLDLMIKKLTPLQQQQVKKQFYRVAASPGGKYALIDYVNFKGEGLTKDPRYKGFRWGLLQVLQKMKGSGVGNAALQEFVKSAQTVLQERVLHAPKHLQAQETKWLRGWNNRLATYLQ